MSKTKHYVVPFEDLLKEIYECKNDQDKLISIRYYIEKYKTSYSIECVDSLVALVNKDLEAFKDS